MKMIYLDNNATTLMPPIVKKAMLEWCNRGNPSGSYASAVEARLMMTEFREYIGKLCGINPLISQLFKITKLDQILDIHEDEEDAMNSF